MYKQFRNKCQATGRTRNPQYIYFKAHTKLWNSTGKFERVSHEQI